MMAVTGIREMTKWTDIAARHTDTPEITRHIDILGIQEARHVDLNRRLCAGETEVKRERRSE